MKKNGIGKNFLNIFRMFLAEWIPVLQFTFRLRVSRQHSGKSKQNWFDKFFRYNLNIHNLFGE